MTAEDDDQTPTPLPLVQTTADQVYDNTFGQGNEPDPSTPLGAAWMWWVALADPVQYRNALDNLSLSPEDWGDYSEAAGLIAARSIATYPIINEDDPAIAYVKFIEYGGEQPAVAFEAAELHDVEVVTVVLPDGADWWQVWGLSHNYMPTANEVRGVN